MTAAVTEGAGSVQVAVSLSTMVDVPVTVTLALSGAAGAADFGTIPMTVTIPAGQLSTTETITVSDDLLVEGDEGYTFTISNVSAGSRAVTSGRRRARVRSPTTTRRRSRLRGCRLDHG